MMSGEVETVEKSELVHVAVSERLWADSQAFAARGLAEFEVLYVFLDDAAERLYLGQPSEAVLAAWTSPASARKCCSDSRQGRRRTRRAVGTSCAI
jgi:hypothetical protein